MLSYSRLLFACRKFGPDISGVSTDRIQWHLRFE
jgi:hypothetical protein